MYIRVHRPPQHYTSPKLRQSQNLWQDQIPVEPMGEASSRALCVYILELTIPSEDDKHACSERVLGFDVFSARGFSTSQENGLAFVAT